MLIIIIVVHPQLPWIPTRGINVPCMLPILCYITVYNTVEPLLYEGTPEWRASPLLRA